MVGLEWYPCCRLKKESIFKNRRISPCDVADMWKTSFVSVQGTLKDNLDISQTATKFILWLMSKE